MHFEPIASDEQAQVYVVARDGTTEAREVQLDQAQGGEWLVEAGLKSAEQVVVEGVQKVVPGGKVAPKPWKSDAAATPVQPLSSR